MSEVTLGQTLALVREKVGPSGTDFTEGRASLTCLHLLLFPEQANSPGHPLQARESELCFPAGRRNHASNIRSRFKYHGW